VTDIKELIARWDSSEGRPYKGSLIDWSAYEAAPDSLGCMCAQGQVLHTVGGWTPDRLRNTAQETADAETAKLLNISRAHAILLRQVNDSIDGAPSIVLTNPEKVLGGEWSKLLDFWWHIDQMNAEQWAAAGAAASEIQGAHIFRADGRPFYFLRMFGFASPDDIPARPADYGVTL
jgi:hypothetical protein